ncbi:MAG: hypothetical protein II821_08140 [Treponema sp.]|nr:hypothetical protein [Treponema sp.]
MKIKNEKLKIVLLLLFAAVCFGFSSCADAGGLHDQKALMVTFEFTGFGDNISGSYSLPGNFSGNDADGWDNTGSDVTMKKGEGISNPIAVTCANIQFSLCPTGEWTRPWYSKGVLEGNGSDAGTMWNFYIDGLDLNAGEVTLLIDASSGVATPVEK